MIPVRACEFGVRLSEYRKTPDPRSFRTLPSSRLLVLARQSEKLHEHLYRKRFGLTLRECHLIGIVGDYKEASLTRTQEAMNLGRASMGLLINRMVRRGMVAKCASVVDRRMANLVLTPRGRAVHKALHEIAISLNEEWLSHISRQQRVTFSNCVEVLTRSARAVRRSRHEPA